jgi:hypothetical protein
MSNRKLKARDKRMLKNTRDGLVERNIVTGEDVKVTEREAEQDLRGIKPQDEIRLLKTAPQSVTSNHKRQQRHYQQSHKPESDKVVQEKPQPFPLQSRLFPTIHRLHKRFLQRASLWLGRNP